MFKPDYGTCIECGGNNLLIVVKKGYCERCNYDIKQAKKKTITKTKKTYYIPKFSKEGAEKKKLVNAGKEKYAKTLSNNRCESCGSQDFCGMSHIISEKECYSNPDIPDWLAYDVSVFVWECHNGKNCHQTTEATAESTYIDKSEQFTFIRKMNLYKVHKPRFYMRIYDYLLIHKPEAVKSLNPVILE